MGNSEWQKVFKKSDQGFTLIELLIVIVIIGILSTIVIANFIGIRARARDAQRKTDLRQIQTAVQLFNSDQGSYPAKSDLSGCGTQFPVSGNVTYMKQVPCDPLKTSQPPNYLYSATPSGCSEIDPSNLCTGYTITACLENGLDSDTDVKRGFTTPPLDVNCSSGRYPYTVTNP